MQITQIITKNYLKISLFIIAIILIVNTPTENLKGDLAKIINVSANSDSILDYYIVPTSVKLDIGEIYTFTSYVEFPTGTVTINSNWSLSNNAVIEKINCNSNSSICKIKTLDGPENLTISSKYKSYSAEAEISISDDITNNNQTSEDNSSSSSTVKLVIVPEEQTMTPGSKYSFVSYIEYPTGQVEVASSWTVSNNLIELDKDCSGECTVYAGVEKGNAVLKASHKNMNASSEIEISGAMINPFKDELPDWADESIIQLASRGIIQGYSDGRYASSDSVTRAQFVLLIKRLLEFTSLYDEQFLNNKDCDLFGDVSSEHYAYTAICYFDYKGWLDVDSDKIKVFRPDLALNRDIASLNIYKSVIEDFMKKDALSEDDMDNLGEVFVDVESDDKYFTEINAVDYYEIMTGDNNGDLFKPDGILNRAEAATILWRLKEKIK